MLGGLGGIPPQKNFLLHFIWDHILSYFGLDLIIKILGSQGIVVLAIPYRLKPELLWKLISLKLCFTTDFLPNSLLGIPQLLWFGGHRWNHNSKTIWHIPNPFKKVIITHMSRKLIDMFNCTCVMVKMIYRKQQILCGTKLSRFSIKRESFLY